MSSSEPKQVSSSSTTADSYFLRYFSLLSHSVQGIFAHNHLFSNQPENIYPQKIDHHLLHNLNFTLCRSVKLQCINPIISSMPQWLINPPHVILKLTLPESSTASAVCHSHLYEIISPFLNPVLCYTDGSKIKNRLGFAYKINNQTFSHRHRNLASIFTAQLPAIFNCLESIISLPPTTHPRPYLIISSYLFSLVAITNTSLSHPPRHKYM